ncbi:MAG TPA: hypothetical protein VI076_08720 [Actinopolymorphaceae bacterium]
MTTPQHAAHPPAPGSGDRESRAGRRRAVLVIVTVLGSLGLIAGLVWPHVVPRVDMIMTSVGPYPVSEAEAASLMAMDGWYAVFAGIGGVLAGAVLGGLYLRHGLTTLFALLGGSILAAVLALVVGSVSESGELLLAWDPRVPADTEITAPLMLHAYGVLLVWPIATLAPLLPLAWLGWEDGDHRRYAPEPATDHSRGE